MKRSRATVLSSLGVVLPRTTKCSLSPPRSLSTSFDLGVNRRYGQSRWERRRGQKREMHTGSRLARGTRPLFCLLKLLSVFFFFPSASTRPLAYTSPLLSLSLPPSPYHRLAPTVEREQLHGVYTSPERAVRSPSRLFHFYFCAKSEIRNSVLYRDTAA